MSSKYVDPTSTCQVIGCVYNNLGLLDSTDKYNITEEDFPDKFHQIIFGAMYKLHELGAKVVTLEAISDFLEKRPKSKAVYEQYKGEEWLLKSAESANIATFDYYYNRLKKFTLLRAFDNYGIDVSDIFDPNNIFDVKKIQLQEEFLDNSSLGEIAEKINNKIEEVCLRYVEGVDGEAAQAGSGALELINRLKETPEVGVPLYGNYINTITRGARLKKLYLRSAPTGAGKALPNYTSVPTPTGKRKVGDIKRGDFLIGRDGKPTKVLNVYPQKERKEVWQVTFKSGRTAECCEEHLWAYYSNRRGTTVYVKSLKEIYEESKTNNFTDSNGYCYRIPMNDPAEFPEKEFAFPPYLLGLDNQEIPTEYLYGSIQQRYSLLQGLMDSHGEINIESGEISYSVSGWHAKNNFVALVVSLGILVDIKGDKVKLIIDYEDKEKIFTLEEKKELVRQYCNKKQRGDKRTDPIVKIERTHRYTEMTCFTVANYDELFLAGETWWVTHNTRTQIADACFIGCNKMYDESLGWISTGKAQPTLFVSTEQELEEIQTMMLAFLSNVNEENILNGKYEEGEEERVRQAALILQESPLYVEELPDFSLQDIENVIKKNIRDHNISYCFFDYVHSSLKILEEITRRSGGVKLREDNILFMLAIRLKDLCNKYGIFLLTSTQLNGNYVSSETPDQNLLRGAKSIADSSDFGSSRH